MPSTNTNILLATRPIVPPWDEASKNFAYFLGKNIRTAHVTLMGTSTVLPELPASAKVVPVFTRSHFGLAEKIRFFWYLATQRSSFDITHYLFTPTKQNTSLIKKYLLPTKGKTIQTVATLREDLYTPSELKELLFADSVVVYTDRSKQKLTNLGLQNVSRIYPGIDLSLYSPQAKNSTILETLELTQDHIIIIYPGEFVRLGATDMLVDFCTTYFTQHLDTSVRFVFACRVKNEADALKKQAVIAQLKEAGVLSYVRFSDTITDMPALYNTCDIVAFPVGNLAGKFDVPLVIIEAYACAKPVILSDLEAFSEFSDPSFCVTIPSDSQSLEKAVQSLLEAPEKQKQLGQNARAFVEKNFDLSTTVREYEDLYQSLLK